MNARAGFYVALGVAAVGGILLVAAAGLLVRDHLRAPPGNPATSPDLLRLKAELATNARDPALLERIRDLDRRLRQDLLDRRAFADRGHDVVTVGALALVASLLVAARLRRRRPAPGEPTQQARVAARTRLALGVALAAIVLTALFVAWSSSGG